MQASAPARCVSARGFDEDEGERTHARPQHRVKSGMLLGHWLRLRATCSLSRAYIIVHSYLARARLWTRFALHLTRE